MGRSYKLYSSAVSTTNATASLRVVRKARIRCILFAVVGQAGGAIDGQLLSEVSKQNVMSYNVSDTPETVLATFAAAMPVNAGAFGANASTVCDIPVEPGETLYLNIYRGGTAPVAMLQEVTIFTD